MRETVLENQRRHVRGRRWAVENRQQHRQNVSALELARKLCAKRDVHAARAWPERNVQIGGNSVTTLIYVPACATSTGGTAILHSPSRISRSS
jgi:hypothetical protein